MPRNVTAQIVSADFDPKGLEVIRLSGREAMNTPYLFDVDVAVKGTTGPTIADLLGRAMVLAFTEGDSAERVIAGIVAEAEESYSSETAVRTLRLHIVPRLFRLTQIRLTEKYAGTLSEIIEKKLNDCDVPFETLFSTTYADPAGTFVAQHFETDLDFLNRRCEHYGIAYYFQTGSNGDCVFISDDNRFLDRRADLVVPFQARGERKDVYALTARGRMAPTKYLVSDYNYQAPSVDLVGETDLATGTGGGVVEYGANVKTQEGASLLSRVRAEEQAAQQFVFRGESDRPELQAGLVFKLEGHPTLGDLELLVTEVEHSVQQPALRTGDGGLAYSNHFKAIPASVAFRPARVTPVPRISGLMSGIVLSRPDGAADRPWLDEFGRYRIQLMCELFDLSGRQRNTRSMRMLQASAGAGYGIHFPLRPGTEVMLAYVNGDPDRPLIVGAVPNQVTPSPVTDTEPLYNRISTSSGIFLEMEDSD